MSRGEDIALAGNQFIERSMGKRSACETLFRSLSLSVSNLARSVKVSSRRDIIHRFDLQIEISNLFENFAGRI